MFCGQATPECERYRAGALDVHECLVEAAYSRGQRKRDQIATANRKLAVLRWLIRLAHERELLTGRQVAFSSEHMTECGRMLGGFPFWGNLLDHAPISAPSASC